MYRIKITPPAEQDMRNAAKYIALELQNKTAAVHLLDEAEDAVYGLEELPFRYALVDDKSLAERGARLLPVRNYLVFYAVLEESKTVVILRFLYGRRDWVTILTADTTPE